jgi:hypothetical protein
VRCTFCKICYSVSTNITGALHLPASGKPGIIDFIGGSGQSVFQ